MSSTVVKKTQEQILLLKSFYKKGMVTAKATALVLEASEATGLSVPSIKNWIHNQKNPSRGKRVKRGKLNEYTAFLARPSENFCGEGSLLGSLAKEKASRYRELKATSTGQTFLRENLTEMSKEPQEMSKTQKKARAEGIFAQMKKQVDELGGLGYKVLSMISQPEMSPILIGSPESLSFVQRHERFIVEFQQTMSGMNVDANTAEESKKYLRQKVQNLFNQLFAKASGTLRSLPYTAVMSGEMLVKLDGMPSGITFKKPNCYSCKQLKAIMQCSSDITMTVSKCTPHAETSHSQDIDVVQSVTECMEESVNVCAQQLVQESAKECVSPTLVEGVPEFVQESVGVSVVEQGSEGVSESLVLPVIECIQEGVSASVLVHEPECLEEGGETEAEDASTILMALANGHNKSIITRTVSPETVKKEKYKRKTSIKRFAPKPNQKLRWQFEDSTGLCWYKGVIKSVQGNAVEIKFQKEEGLYSTTICKLKKYLKNGTLELL